MSESPTVLQEEKDNLDIILQNIIDIVIFLDENDCIIMANSAFYSTFGCDKENILNEQFDSVITLENNKSKILLSEIRNGLEKNKNTVISSMLEIICNGRIFGTVGISSFENTDGKHRTLLTIHDKTKEHELENMKLDFVSMAAHELRTPITSIRGYSSLMLEELSLGEQLPVDEWKLLLSRISVSAEQLLALVENLLNVTKIEKGVLSLTCTRQDWEACIKEVLQGFEETAATKKITVLFAPSSEKLFANVDKMRIEEVLANLVSNAINYTQTGGMVTVYCKKSWDNKYIETYVKDNGPGIPKSAQSHLFEKFFRVSGPLEQGSKGNGLGLYISKSIVKMHNGTIWVDSDEGRGATFIFSVPVSE